MVPSRNTEINRKLRWRFFRVFEARSASSQQLGLMILGRMLGATNFNKLTRSDGMLKKPPIQHANV